MPPSDRAVARAAERYVRDVCAAAEFIRLQDKDRAEDRYERLLSRLHEARELLRNNPDAGRPARLLCAQTAQARAIATRLQERARSLSLPMIRELIVKPYILLYAHGEGQVLLTALKHERQQGFAALDR